jgi:DNA replication protein DnaC
LLKKLTLFSLKKQQLQNIVTLNGPSFLRSVSIEEIVNNPYVLSEEYYYEITDEDLNLEEIADDSIDLFKIDIGMFPEKYIKGNIRLQNLAQGSPQRLRAVIKDYLYYVGSQGDCFASIEDVYANILEYPLFHRRELKLTRNQLLDPKYIKHFEGKLKIVENQGTHFFYLNETLRAEEIVRQTVTTLIEREDHKAEISNIDDFVKTQAEKLKEDLKCFNNEVFIQERTKVLKNILKKSFYVLSGKPGTGKTKVIEKILEELNRIKELAVVLAPTGKASLRLKRDCGAKNAQTIDRFIYSSENGYREVLENFAEILKGGRETERIQNLIIDESSMIDLQKLATLFMMLRLNGLGKIKRVIMVGDENQLPPIGFGKPFYDIIQFIKLDAKFREGNYVKLLTNCRNEIDPKIIEFADVFAGKNRYYSELLDEVLRTKGDVSEGLAIEKWNSIDDLHSKIDQRLDKTILDELSRSPEIDLSAHDKSEQINLLFGLLPSGWVKGGEWQGIENFQIITPYRIDRFGCMALSNFFKTAYPRGHWSDNAYFRRKRFDHSDKIMRLTNEYVGKALRLSNGSIGVVNNQFQQGHYRQYYFTDQEKPLYSNAYYKPINEDEDYELAYAITVHKAQGSDFKDVFLVLPGKRSLLSKELLYTALTRSKRSTTLFLQEEEGRKILEEARDHSAVLQRNTSLFEKPENAKDIFEPAKGKRVRSKIEYIIFKALEASGLKFDYEEPLFFEKGPEKIKPDFTVYVYDQTYYWEHLGELDTREYWSNWKARCDWYKANGKFAQLVTTDDLGGVKEEIIQKVIKDISEKNLVATPKNDFSDHHYPLYKAQVSSAP